MNCRKILAYLLILGIMLLLTGCWNSREVNDLAIVMAMGVDKDPKKGEYIVSFQVVNPGIIATGKGGGGGDMSVTFYKGTGKTLFEAIRKTSKKVPRQLFFAHISLIAIGESLAKEGIHELFDFFDRSLETRLTTLVLVARKDKAENIVKAMIPLESIPANGIVGKLETSSNNWSENIRLEIGDVIRTLVSPGKELLISGVSLVGDPEEGKKKSNVDQTEVIASVEIDQMALFKEGKLKRWLREDESKGTLWILDKLKGTIVNIDCGKKLEQIGIEILRSNTNVEVKSDKGKPTFHLIIREEANISEVKCPIDLSKPEEFTKLEKKLREKTKQMIMAAVSVAQDEKSDIFGFGEELKRSDPKAWEKMEGEWDEIFANSKVEVKVDAFIRRPGMRVKPYLSELKR
ncbi:Ger(x)C family spore germination protein [Ammoniphilus sp. YIM 78166]|uniref:Ger(x)C family spore germination protein n=1 Tax=Ammoniphilus sp. YIM 78166 TaxID=1644106 RepID=UPI0010706499|nr:Ger(x)C family spore germination protein [Ammoniphilus sp. YIM 78166]